MQTKYLVLLVMLFTCSFARAGYIQHQIENIPSYQFEKVSLFMPKEASPEKRFDLLRSVSKFDLLQVNETSLKRIVDMQANALEITVPVDGVWQTIQLVKSNTISDNTIFSTHDERQAQQVEYQQGAYYHGVIKNQANSIVAISFFEHDIIGVIGTNQGNYVVGHSNKHDFLSTEYIVFNDRNFLIPNIGGCESDEDMVMNPIRQQSLIQPETITVNCVKVYIECDYEFYLDHGSNTTTSFNFATGIFNLTNALYLNDSISTGISQIVIWTVTDPYISATTTSNALNLFGAQVAGGFNGDLAHLFSNRSMGGGIAWIDVLCYIPQYQTAVSASLNNSLTALPTYSWNANVVTHEMGHNLGSQHTHACVWNGNSTRIDNCGGHAGYTSGSCADLPDPVGGGTIMSYCHLISGIGINFNLGFGPQPGNLIRTFVNGASCLTPCVTCNSDITVTNTISTPLTESTTWIKTSGQTTILSSTNVKFDANPNIGYVLFEPTTSTDFFLAAPGASNTFIAQALDGCGGSTPARMANSSDESSTIQSTFNLHPNPVTNELNIENTMIQDEEIQYEMYTIDGKLIQADQHLLFNQKAKISTQHLSIGMYFIKMYSSQGISMFKFQKN